MPPPDQYHKETFGERLANVLFVVGAIVWFLAELAALLLALFIGGKALWEGDWQVTAWVALAYFIFAVTLGIIVRVLNRVMRYLLIG